MSVEIVRPALAASAARELVDAIRQSTEIVWRQVVRAYEGRAWLALGYGSWDELCDAELDGAHLRLPREERQEVVASLRDSGMSTRAIAAATGVSVGTVHADLAGTCSELNTSTGVDGKSYPAKVTTTTRTTEATKIERSIDLATGEVISAAGVGSPPAPAPAADPEAEVVAAIADAIYTDAERAADVIRKAVSGLHRALLSNHSVESLVDVLDDDDLDDIARFADLLRERVDAVRQARPQGLRVIQGGAR